MQNGVVGKAYERDRVIANIQTLVDMPGPRTSRCSGYSTPETRCRGDPRDGSTSLSSSAYKPSPWFTSRTGDSFEATDREELLAERGVGRLVVTGAQTEECIRSTLHGALVRGYDATFVADAHTTEDMRERGFPVAPEEAPLRPPQQAPVAASRPYPRRDRRPPSPARP